MTRKKAAKERQSFLMLHTPIHALLTANKVSMDSEEIIVENFYIREAKARLSQASEHS